MNTPGRKKERTKGGKEGRQQESVVYLLSERIRFTIAPPIIPEMTYVELPDAFEGRKTFSNNLYLQVRFIRQQR
jgi:hypothetical protein